MKLVNILSPLTLKPSFRLRLANIPAANFHGTDVFYNYSEEALIGRRKDGAFLTVNTRTRTHALTLFW